MGKSRRRAAYETDTCETAKEGVEACRGVCNFHQSMGFPQVHMTYTTSRIHWVSRNTWNRFVGRDKIGMPVTPGAY